jgi:von Willebrand factor type A domain
MPDVSVSVVSLLDCSSSMASAMPMVIIDGKAFIRSARPGDQIAVVQFQSSASMVYPATQTFATVDGNLSVTAAAAAAIGRVTSAGMTNMNQAVTIANNVLNTASLPTRAYMLLSDGDWNQGGDPGPVTPTTLPIFVCGLGPYMQRSYVASMLARNPNSQYIASPNAYQMMQVFNSIRGLAAQANVARNVINTYSGTDYQLTPVQVSSSTDEGQFTVVWSNPNLSYTSGVPDANHVNIVLIDPQGQTTPLQPVVTDPGYAIFNVQSPAPGQWQVLSQYASQSGTYATTAGFEFDTQLELALDVPRTADPGSALTIRAHVTEQGRPLEGAQVGIRLRAPAHDVPKLLDQRAAVIEARVRRVGGESGADEQGRLKALREIVAAEHPPIDLLAEHATYHALRPAEDGSYVAEVGPLPHAGDYTIEATATAFASEAKTRFERATTATVMVGG